MSFSSPASSDLISSLFLFSITFTVLNWVKSEVSLTLSEKKFSRFSVLSLRIVPTISPSGNTAEYPLVTMVSPFWKVTCRGNSSSTATVGSMPSHTRLPKKSLSLSLHYSLNLGLSSEMILAEWLPTTFTIPTTPFWSTTPISGFTPSSSPLLIVM